MSIVLRQITKTYHQQKALDEVSFDVSPNTIVGFLGPNGAGKSTTMKIMTGLIPADSGTVVINGLNLENAHREIKKLIGYLPENNPLYGEMYVREILAFEAGVHQIANKSQRIEEVMHLTGLESEQHKKVQQLSKGYRQRVGLAMAIIHDPQVLILDEPTTGLDPNQILEIRSLIKTLGKEKTVLFSTHIMQEVEAICDAVVILKKGKVMEDFALNESAAKYPGLTMEDIFVQITK
ncbi:ABC transporter, ATP-binding protein [Sphingobacterium spiritivorum ATCC 33300]|uniref:ABC transporter, ATP-binding protein n=1 Tax=Sphingobacterium spiritivorum ATCC 33300 TaxID=525372 RepID=C2FSI0_SPHSI|nr:ATP-binding cassette domain-containing protein [Sphingobacterium spiritivorum]EEI93954.1 ABC transporter, ATP-binding protein [Sphingobacterium spiritivorum ATCC 33300]QQS94253.1 ATP-binding cassette domain-containing protein [Sphingobacterium spiritivorum]